MLQGMGLGAGALAQLVPVGGGEQRVVAQVDGVEPRRGQQLGQVQLQGGGLQQVDAAHDRGHAQVLVGDH